MACSQLRADRGALETGRADRAVLIFYLLIIGLKRFGKISTAYAGMKVGSFSAKLSCGDEGQLKML